MKAKVKTTNVNTEHLRTVIDFCANEMLENDKLLKELERCHAREVNLVETLKLIQHAHTELNDIMSFTDTALRFNASKRKSR